MFSIVLRTYSVSLVAVGVLALLRPGDPAYLGSPLNPYLLLAIATGAITGLRGSLFVAPLLALTYLILLPQSLDAREVESLFNLGTLTLPLAMVVISPLLGAMTDGLRGQIQEERVASVKQSVLVSDLEKINAMLIKEKREIEARLNSQGQSVTRLLEHAQVLETSDANEIVQALVDLTCEQIGEDNCYGYVIEGQALVCRGFRDTDPVRFPERILLSELPTYPLMEAAIQTGRLVRFQDLIKTEGVLAGEYGLATPLLTNTEQIVGVLFIRHLRFLNYVPATFATFTGLARWGAMSLARAARVQRNRETTYRDEVTGLFSYPYFLRRLEACVGQARKYSLPLYAFHFQILDFSRVPAVQKVPVLKLVASILERTARDIDSCTIGKDPGEFFTVMMIASPSEVEFQKSQALEAFATLQNQVAALRKVSLKVGLCTLDRKHLDAEGFLSAEVALS